MAILWKNANRRQKLYLVRPILCHSERELNRASSQKASEGARPSSEPFVTVVPHRDERMKFVGAASAKDDMGFFKTQRRHPISIPLTVLFLSHFRKAEGAPNKQASLPEDCCRRKYYFGAHGEFSVVSTSRGRSHGIQIGRGFRDKTGVGISMDLHEPGKHIEDFPKLIHGIILNSVLSRVGQIGKSKGTVTDPIDSGGMGHSGTQGLDPAASAACDNAGVTPIIRQHAKTINAERIMAHPHKPHRKKLRKPG